MDYKMSDPFNRCTKLDQDKSSYIDILKSTAEVLWTRLTEIEFLIGTSRELSLARTKLEECIMWGSKGIANSKDVKDQHGT